jgi:hypothetical protein
MSKWQKFWEQCERFLRYYEHVRSTLEILGVDSRTVAAAAAGAAAFAALIHLQDFAIQWFGLLLLATFAAALIIVCALVWLWNQWQKNKADEGEKSVVVKPRRRAWGSLISVVLYATAVASWYRASRWETEQVPPPVQLITAPNDSASAAPISTPSNKPAKIYSEAEKEDLRNATRELAKIIADQGDAVSSNIEATLRVWDALYNQGQVSAPQELVKRIDNLTTGIETLQQTLKGSNEYLKAYWGYRDELAPIIGLSFKSNDKNDPLVFLEQSANSLRTKANAFALAAKYNDNQLLKALADSSSITEFQDAQARYLDWLKRTTQRINNFRSSL